MQVAAVCKLNALAAGVLLLSVTAQAAVDKQTARLARQRSLPPALTAVICERPIQASDLANSGLFDAQVDVVVMQLKDAGSKITDAVAKDRAISLASSGEQLSYAHGVCPNGAGWAAAFPAPEAVRVDSSMLKISDVAASECIPKSLRVLFVPENKGRSFLVPVGTDLTAQLPDAKGYGSLTCVPKQFAKSGVREWALIPLSGAKVNASDLLPLQGLKDKDELLSWINQKRRVENLPAFSLDQELTAAAQGLAHRKTVRHNLEALASARTNLQKKGIEPLGENRVQGKNLAEAAGLLWMSPSHRDLILSPTGEVIGLSVSESDRGPFVVMVVGRKAAGPVAKK